MRIAASLDAVYRGSQRSASAMYRSCLCGCRNTEVTWDWYEVRVGSSGCGSFRTVHGPW
jgi:hypothetical protein